MLRLRQYKPCDANKIISWAKDETAFRKWTADRYNIYPITAAYYCYKAVGFQEVGELC